MPPRKTQQRQRSGRRFREFFVLLPMVQSVIPLPDLFDWWSCILLWCFCLQDFTSCYELFWSMQIFELFSVLKPSSSPATGQPFCPLRVRELRWTCRPMNPLWQYGLVPWVQLYSILVQLSQWEFLVARTVNTSIKFWTPRWQGVYSEQFWENDPFPWNFTSFFLVGDVL